MTPIALFWKRLLAACTFSSLGLIAAEPPTALKSIVIDCEAWSEGVPPKEVFVVDGTIKIASKDGGKVIMVDPVPIVDATAQVGESAAGSATIEARVFASKKGRSFPRFGVSVHGMSGHRLIVNCAKKQLELIKADEVIASAAFTWTTDTWTMIKLGVATAADGNWQIEGKAWVQGGEEPKEPMIKHQEPAAKLKGNGKAAIWGTPFSELPVYFDDIKVQVAVKAE